MGTARTEDPGGPIRVLLADGKRAPRRRAAAALRADARFELCACVGDAPTAVAAALDYEPDVCVLDVGLPGGGTAAAQEIAARIPQARILMVADDGATNQDLFAALRSGASGYLRRSEEGAALPDAIATVASGDAALSEELVMRLIEAFRDPARPRRRVVGEPHLTAREWQVLQLVREGRSTAEIAEELVLSPVTVRSHLQAIQRKLHAPDRESALALFDEPVRSTKRR